MNTLNRKSTLILSLLALLVFLSCSRTSLKKEAEMQVENKSHFGLLQGLVTDEDDQPIPGVYIAIKKIHLSVNADTLGYYTLQNIPPGKYDIEAITVGFKKIIIPNVKIYSDSTTILNISMEVQPMIFPQIEPHKTNSQNSDKNIQGGLGSLKVTVTDIFNQPIRYAYIRLSGTMIGATADSNGLCFLDSIVPGMYDVNIAAVGHKRGWIKNVNILPESLSVFEVSIEIDTLILPPVRVKEK